MAEVFLSDKQEAMLKHYYNEHYKKEYNEFEAMFYAIEKTFNVSFKKDSSSYIILSMEYPENDYPIDLEDYPTLEETEQGYFNILEGYEIDTREALIEDLTALGYGDETSISKYCFQHSKLVGEVTVEQLQSLADDLGLLIGYGNETIGSLTDIGLLSAISLYNEQVSYWDNYSNMYITFPEPEFNEPQKEQLFDDNYYSEVLPQLVWQSFEFLCCDNY